MIFLVALSLITINNLYLKKKISVCGISHVIVFIVHFDTSPEVSSQSSLSPVAISGNLLISTDVPRRSKRIASKKVCR